MKRILVFLISLVFLLLAVSYFYLGIEKRKQHGWFILRGNALDSALVVNGLNYTFNYKQHNDLLQELNSSKKVKVYLQPYEPGAIEKIMIYLFDQKNPLELIPASSDFEYFRVSTWEEPYYLKLSQPKDLKTILETAYDT